MKFLVPNYSCLQNPLLGGYRPQILVLSVLCPQLNLLNPPPNKIPGYATVPTYGNLELNVFCNFAILSLALSVFPSFDHINT